jgi:hypothetical protein
MIRRDYILRMLEEFFEVLSRIRALQKGQKWGEASLAAEKGFQQLVGLVAQEIARLSETELLALIIKGEPTQAVRDKTLLLATLLKESGDIAAEQERPAESLSYYLKGLHMLLAVLAREEPFDCPAFVPRVEGFLAALGDFVLPLSTQAMLMQHFERLGEFAKAEDALFAMLEVEPNNPDLLSFGIGFYQRLKRQTDDSLEQGNLPRAEVETGLGQLVARQAEGAGKTVAPH